MNIGNHILFILLTAVFIGMVALSKCNRPQGGVWSYISILWNAITKKGISNRRKTDWIKGQTSAQLTEPETETLEENGTRTTKEKEKIHSQPVNENMKGNKSKSHYRHAKKHVNDDIQIEEENTKTENKHKKKHRHKNQHRTGVENHNETGQQTGNHHENNQARTTNAKNNDSDNNHVNQYKQNPAKFTQDKHEQKDNKKRMNPKGVHDNRSKEIMKETCNKRSKHDISTGK